MQERPEASPRRWRSLALYLLPWTGLGLLGSLQIMLAYRYAGLEVSWPRALGLGLAQWYLWAALYPVLAWAVAKVPFGRRSLLKPALVLLPITLVVSAINVGAEQALVAVVGIVPLQPQDSNRFQVSLLIAWVLVGIAHAALYSRQSQTRRQRALQLETELATARLQLLQRQLRPHFLFNTLHAITALMKRDPDTAERMMVRLSDLLRISLEHTGRERVPLQSEIEFARLYAGIQQMRFGDRLTVDWQIDEKALGAEVPGMLLQPLLENGVEHGLSKSSGPGEIQVVAERVGDRLLLIVRDNGPGPPADGPDPGIGLENTRRRLEAMYGLEASIELEREDDGGARVSVEFPFEDGT